MELEVEELKHKLLDCVKEYINDVEALAFVEKACDFAYKAHITQKRKSGEPYIIHPINVSIILAELKVSPNTLAAGLLHDVIEDTEYTYEEIEEMFNTDVANLVEGVTKISMMKFSTASEAEIENQKKLIIGMIRDVRVIVIKLADRLHNMRTLFNLPLEKQKKIANETIEIFAPVAHRLGIYIIKSELEDLSLYYLKQDIYNQIKENVDLMTDNLDESLGIVKSLIKSELEERNLQYDISGRLKSIYSIYKKMANKNKRIEDIYDILAIRIIVNSVTSCYSTLGVVHELYRPIPQRFKDYIAMPKPNMYQALHTTVIGPNGQPYEIQIKTHEMHEIAERGIASHWMYKENSQVTPKQEQEEIEKKYEWFRNMMSFDENDYDSEEYLEAIKNDIFGTTLYIFTPNGNTIHLPQGSTPIDFAYKIHTEIGHTMTGSKINGIMVPINTMLQTGDVVEIMTNSNSLGPSIDWIDIVKTSNARNKIRQFFRQSKRDEMIELGIYKLKKVFKKHNISYNNFEKSVIADELVTSYKQHTFDEFVFAVGYGKITSDEVVEKYLLLLKNEKEDTEWILTKNYRTEKGVIVPGVNNLPLDISKCCTPIPGDEIIGYVSKTGVIKVHRKICPNVVNNPNEERQIDVMWIDTPTGLYETNLLIKCVDRLNLLSDILHIFGPLKSNVTEMNSKTNITMVEVKLTILVSDRPHFNKVVDNLKKVKGVQSVERVIK